MQKIVVIDYGSGNIKSAEKAVEYVIQEASMKAQVIVSDQPSELKEASHIILPGQGSFIDCYHHLNAIDGMIETLHETVIKKGCFFLGICVGMQLMAKKGFEHDECNGLGWIDGEVHKINCPDKDYKIPHMGWNQLTQLQNNHSFFNNIPNNDDVYFVHSYAMKCQNRNEILATTDYGQEVVAVVGKDNYIGTQFHPEKSQKTGLQLIKNFLLWKI